MVDTAFDDFLDSDDDEFFLEASNNFLNNDSVFESLPATDRNDLQEQSNCSTSHYFKSSETSVIKQNFTSTNIIDLNKSEDTTRTIKSSLTSDNNPSNRALPAAEKNYLQEIFKDSASHYVSCSEKTVVEQNFVNTNKIHLNKFEDTIKTTNVPVISSGNNPDNKLQLNIHQNANANTSFTAVPVVDRTENSNLADLKEPKVVDKNISSSECNTPVYSSSTKAASPDSLHINISSRFTPGYTPKAKKRKLPGPAGFLEFIDGTKEGISGSSDKMLSMDMDFENIISSQYTPELLSSSSWQKLQTAVSSCSNLHSTANYYSIQRVLQESSKKKLPKHMVVPLLCILLKKLNNKGSAVISVFMDDTGEINGKIDPEVLSSYKEFFVEGTALILKKVTFLCNVLILKAENLVSIYHPSGTEKHPQNLESILETSEPLKPMNCECLKLSNIKRVLKSPDYNTLGNHTSSCISLSQNKVINASNQDKIPSNVNTHINYKSSNNQIQDKITIIPNQTANRNMTNLISKQIPPVGESHSKILRSDAFLENLLDEDNCMDEFDELLGNLDETSFMGDV